MKSLLKNSAWLGIAAGLSLVNMIVFGLSFLTFMIFIACMCGMFRGFDLDHKVEELTGKNDKLEEEAEERIEQDKLYDAPFRKTALPNQPELEKFNEEQTEEFDFFCIQESSRSETSWEFVKDDDHKTVSFDTLKDLKTYLKLRNTYYSADSVRVGGFVILGSEELEGE